MNKAVYIPTYNRAEFAELLVKQCHEYMPEIPIFLVIDSCQFNLYSHIGNCSIHQISEEGKQIGWARNQVVLHAAENGFSHILMLDDDVKLGKNIETIFDNFDEHPECAWIGAYFSFYSIANVIKNTGFCYTYSLGYMAIALDIAKVLSVGNYDPEFCTHEDQDLSIQLMMAGFYQAIDSNIVCSFRNTTMSGNGGCSSWNYPENEILMRRKLIEKYGNFFGMRKGKCFTQWAKMFKAGIFKVDETKTVEYKKRLLMRKNL